MSFFEKVWFLLEQYYPLFLYGIVFTLGISIAGTVIGFVIGLIVASIRTIPEHENDSAVKRALLGVLKFILAAYVEVFRGTPMIIQAAVFYYGIFAGVDIYANIVVLIVVSINTGAYMAEIIRGGIISIDKGQTEGAHSIGMNHAQTMLYVVLPQAIRNIMPSVGNEFVVNIKDTSVLNVISVTELYFQAKSAAGTYAMLFQAFTICAAVYFVLTFTVTRILRMIERKMDGSGSYTIYGSQGDFKAEIHINRGGA